MKKLLLSALIVMLPAVLWGKDKTPIPAGACVAVEPGGDPCKANWGIHAGGLTPGCFTYVESENLPLSLTKTYYLEKDLKGLEQRGLKVVVTSKESIRANPDSGCHQPKH
jgi:hypothetical protein